MQKLHGGDIIGPGDWVWEGEVEGRNKINPTFWFGQPS